MRACLFDLDVYSPGLRRSSPPNGKRCSTVFCGNAARTPSCPSIMSPTSVTAGTIFHRIRTPLSTWFAAIWFLTSQKNGMSALGLQRGTGIRHLRDRVGLVAEAAPGDGATRPGPALG